MRTLVTSFAFAALVTACHNSTQQQVEPDAAPPPIDAIPMVTFTYAPSWAGVVSVDVIGGFGQASDWTTPLVSLTQQGNVWTGTAQLPAGTYPYVFHVVGDADAGAAKSATFARYAVDPTQTSFVVCPMASPTYSTTMNPCSQLTVPVASAATMNHVAGRVVVGGAPAAGYLVVLEREEPTTHHFFVDRTTSASDGTYTLAAAQGNYRLQVQHPQFESATDAQLAPMAMNILRRQISAAQALSADVAIADVEMAFASYPNMTPTVSSTLPTTFTFASGVKTTLDVYGTGNEIGDPWYGSTATQSGTASFDGTFNKPQKGQNAVVLGTKYYWGVEQPHADGNGLTWTAQSLVFAMTWN